MMEHHREVGTLGTEREERMDSSRGKAEAQYRTRSTIYTVGSSGRNAVVT